MTSWRENNIRQLEEKMLVAGLNSLSVQKKFKRYSNNYVPCI